MAILLRVKELAEAKGLNIGSLSRRADLGISTVRRMWHGTATGIQSDDKALENINLKALEAIAVALGVEPGELLERVPDK